MSEQMYEIIKFFDDPNKRYRVQRSYGLCTLERAQRICNDPTTSTNCKKPFGKNWFLGYSKAGTY